MGRETTRISIGHKGRTLPARIVAWVLTDDVRTKGVALVCAVFIWFLVSELISDQIDQVVPVLVTSVDQTGVLAVSDVRFVRVTLEGPRESLRAMAADRLARAYAVEPDRLAISEASKTIDLPAEDFLDLPTGIRIKAIEPARIKVDLTRVALRHLAVRPRMSGEPAPGYTLAEVRFSPSEIRALVPIELGERNEVETTPIEIAGRDRSFSQRVQARAEMDGRAIHLLDDRPIQARVEIEEVDVVAETEVEVLILRPPSYSLRVKELDPKTVIVRIVGPRTRLADLSAVRALIDLRDLEPDRIRRDLEFPHYFDLRVELPAGTRLVEAFIVGGSGQKEHVERVKVLFVEP